MDQLSWFTLYGPVSQGQRVQQVGHHVPLLQTQGTGRCLITKLFTSKSCLHIAPL